MFSSLWTEIGIAISSTLQQQPRPPPAAARLRDSCRCSGLRTCPRVGCGFGYWTLTCEASLCGPLAWWTHRLQASGGVFSGVV